MSCQSHRVIPLSQCEDQSVAERNGIRGEYRGVQGDTYISLYQEMEKTAPSTAEKESIAEGEQIVKASLLRTSIHSEQFGVDNHIYLCTRDLHLAHRICHQ